MQDERQKLYKLIGKEVEVWQGVSYIFGRCIDIIDNEWFVLEVSANINYIPKSSIRCIKTKKE